MNERNGLDINGAAETMLLHWELDLGLSMAELALASLQDGSLVDADRWKAHAVDALTSAASTAASLSVTDTVAENRLHELAFRVSTL